MASIKNKWASFLVATATMLLATIWLSSCSIKYGFNGASIDYSKTKTIQIVDFPIRSGYVWGPMGPMFNNKLKDEFANHTRLRQVKRNGDLIIQGEITQYSQRNKAVSSEGYSAQTELSMTVNVKFTNTKNHKEDFEKQFTATQTYETTQSLASVQEQTRRTDVRRPHRPDIQRYGGQLVKSNNRKNGYCAFNQTP